MNPTDDRRVALALAGLFAVVGVLAGADVLSDLREGGSSLHVATEGVLLAVGVGGAGWMGMRARRLLAEASQRTRVLEANLAATRAEAERFRSESKELLAGLGDAIDRQLGRWGLSPAEKEIALLLLKGLSHKEIAEVRQSSEATVRQQARALYKKAGLSGRSDLAAFFLEDLLGPRVSAPAPPAPAPSREG